MHKRTNEHTHPLIPVAVSFNQIWQEGFQFCLDPFAFVVVRVDVIVKWAAWDLLMRITVTNVAISARFAVRMSLFGLPLRSIELLEPSLVVKLISEFECEKREKREAARCVWM